MDIVYEMVCFGMAGLYHSGRSVCQVICYQNKPESRVGDSRGEVWISDELNLPVLETFVTPEEESSWRLFNVRRIEPDKALFSVPADYTDASAAVGP